jgi:hypothetical protein
MKVAGQIRYNPRHYGREGFELVVYWTQILLDPDKSLKCRRGRDRGSGLFTAKGTKEISVFFASRHSG